VADTHNLASEATPVYQLGVSHSSTVTFKQLDKAAPNGVDITCVQVVDTHQLGSELPPV